MVNTLVYAGTSISASGVFASTASRTTDERGQYSIFGLPPGEYYVGVGVKVFLTDASDLFRVSLKGVQPTQTFFPSAASPTEAVPVTVKEGEDAAGIDIVMRPVLPTDAPLHIPALPVPIK